MRTPVHYLVLLLGTHFFATPAFAQEATTNKQVGYSDAERAEAKKIQEECVSTARMNTFYDCQCFADKFIAKRHELGPNLSADHVRLYLSDECRNGPGIAKHEYNSCMKHNLHLPKNINAKEFCNCYAGEFTRQYMEYEGALSGRTNALFAAKANNLCKHKQGDGGNKKGAGNK